jgi:diguanylate cyclase (GGDEF)-like protein/PAS domain S-box-containing protein
MNTHSITTLKKNLSLRYVFALGLIAMLSTAAFLSLHYALLGSDSTAYIVNISGKQRMLSQHIALDAHRIHHSFHKDSVQPHIRGLIENELLRHTQEFLQANTKLSSGMLNKETRVTLSPVMQGYYFGEMNLAKRVQEYATLAQSIIGTDMNQSFSIVQKINHRSEYLLKDLNTVVQQYQREGEERLKNIRNMEIVVWFSTLLILLLEILFIFQPMVRRILKLSYNELEIRNKLEHEVAIRTLDLKRANERLRLLASHDPLTGLNNRLFFEKELEKIIEMHKLNGINYGILMIDIDWFKKVNDNYGHDAGDAILIELSRILKDTIRKGDEVYRTGGEEFVLLFNRIEFEDCEHITRKIIDMVHDHIFEINTLSIHVTISGGLYHSSLFHVSDQKSILKWVDMAMYESKANGRNRITVAKEKEYLEVKSLTPSRTRLCYEDHHCRDLKSCDADIIEILGYSREAFLSGEVDLKAIAHPDDSDIWDKIPHHPLKKEAFVTTVRLFHHSGHVVIFRLEAYEEEGCFVLNLQKAITLAKSVKDDLLIYNFHAMMENSNDFIYFKDRYHVFTAASQTLVSLTSVQSREELVGKTDYEVFDIEFADRYFVLEKQIFSGEVEVAREIQPIRDKDGNQGWVDNRKYPIKDVYGTVIGLFGVARIISNDEYEKITQ